MNNENFQTLVRRIYDPAFSFQIKEIESQLQAYQKSPDGWYYANLALESDEQSLRFFGALTFWSKLKTEGLLLTTEQCEEVLFNLLSRYIWLSSQDEVMIVKQKLCSALVALFVLPNSGWRRCIKHVAFCCVTGKVLPESTSLSHNICDLLENIDSRMAMALVIFTKTAAEDLNKIDNENRRLDYVQKWAAENIEDASNVIKLQLMKLHNTIQPSASYVLGCYRAWIAYTSDVLQASATELESLRDLIDIPISYIFVEDISEDVVDFFLDIVDEQFEFLTTRAKNTLSRVFADSRAIQRVKALEVHEDEDTDDIAAKFGRLVLVFGQASITNILELPENSTLSTIKRITKTQNYFSFNKALAEEIISFWDCFNTETSTATTPIFDRAMSCWIEAIKDFCQMAKLPANLIGPIVPLMHASKQPSVHIDLNSLNQSSDLAQSEFSHFRTSRVAELIQDSYVTYGVAVLERLVGLILSPDSDWTDIEATFTLLSGMSEFIPETSSVKEEEQVHLSKLFRSPLFQGITSPESYAPLRVRKLVVKFVGEHHNFLGRHQQLLLQALEFLFQFMTSGNALDECSRAIYRLCDHNRKFLASEWEQLMGVSETHFRSDESNQITRRDILGANAAVISCLVSEKQTIVAMHRLLGMLERCLQAALAAPSQNRAHSIQLAGEETLDYLSTIGKAFQTPDDVPVDIDSSNEDSVWTKEEGVTVHNGIVQLLQLILQGNFDNGSFIEGACNILRSGYPETTPGPFVFQPHITVDLLTSTKFDNPMLYMAVDTASRFVSSNSSNNSRAGDAVSTLTKWVCRILDHFPSPHEDPEVAYSCVEFFSRCTAKYLAKVLTLPNQGLIKVSKYTLDCLKGADPLPKRAAAKYWGAFLRFDNSAKEEGMDEIVNMLNAHLLSSGPHLSAVLMSNFSGLAARSDLDALFEPLKGLITSPLTATHASAWLKTAMLDASVISVPENRVSTANKEQFVQQIIRLRGDRRTKSIVKEFWMASRGMS